jgi:hypothetical protein
MKITSEQLSDYERDGYLFLPEYFSSREVDLMAEELPDVCSKKTAKLCVRFTART